MSAPRLRALVLCAGRGTRLEPLTAFRPKPLLPVAGTPIVGRTLSVLREAGCEEAIVNLHHLGEQIRDSLGEFWEGMPLLYSSEAKLLGTFGALSPVRNRLADADAVLVVNGDSVCRWPIRALVRRHRKKNAAATLLVHRNGPRPELGGGVAVDDAQRVVAIRDSEATRPVHRRHLFAGAQILSPGLLDRAPDPPAPADLVADLYQPLLSEGGRIEAVVTRRRWHDLGTPGRYLDGCLDLAGGHRLSLGSSTVSPEASLGRDVVVRSSVIERGAAVGDDCRIEDSVLLEDVRVPAGTHLKRTVIGPGVRLPSNADVGGKLVTRLPPGHALAEDESLLGDLVYRRIPSSD